MCEFSLSKWNAEWIALTVSFASFSATMSERFWFEDPEAIILMLIPLAEMALNAVAATPLVLLMAPPTTAIALTSFSVRMCLYPPCPKSASSRAFAPLSIADSRDDHAYVGL